MDFIVSQDTVGQVFAVCRASIHAETQVLVDNGETVCSVACTNKPWTDVTKVPLFGDLPYLGRLFRQT